MAKRRKRRKGNSPPPQAAGPAEEITDESAIQPPTPPESVEPAPAAPVVRDPRLASAGASDVGRKRDNNQDSFLIDEKLRLFVVADGMGGHAGGGTASRLAVETLQAQITKARAEKPAAFGPPPELESSPLPDVLREAVEAACFSIFREARGNPSLAGMGTTTTVLLVHGPHAFIAHVGDSRLYLVRGEEIHQVSEDHSLVNEQIKAGVLTPDEARHSQFKNVITRSVGFEEHVLVDLLGLAIEAGDTFVICCDGLSNHVEDREIAALARSEKIEDLPLKLIALANERGGDDNITAVVVRVLEV